MIEFGKRERAALLIFITQNLHRLRKGEFDFSEIICIAEWMLWRMDQYRENATDTKEYDNEKFLLRGYIALEEYVFVTINYLKRKQLKQIADDWFGNSEYGKYFGDS